MSRRVRTASENQGPGEPRAPGAAGQWASHDEDPSSLPLITLQDLVSWVYLYPVQGASRLLPTGLSRWLLRRLAPLYGWLRPSSTRRIGALMRRALGGRKPEGDASTTSLARSFMARDLRKVGDDLLIRRLGSGYLRTAATVRGLGHLQEALALGRGVIVISGHFHANRLAKYHLRRIGYPMLSVRRRVTRSPGSGRFGDRFVAPAYGRFLAGNVEDELYARDPGLGAGLLRRLRENGIVNVHIDAALSSERMNLPMLHLQWPVPVGFLRLAELAAVPLLPMLCLGDSDAFEIRFDEAIRFEGRSSPEATRRRLQTLVDRLSGWIIEYPDQWELWTRMERFEKRHADR